MITGDMFTFSMIYIIFLFGFSQSFYFLQYNVENAELFEEYPSTYVGLFQMTLGEYDVSILYTYAHNNSWHVQITVLFFISFSNPIHYLL